MIARCLIGPVCGLLVWAAIIIFAIHITLEATGWTLEELVENTIRRVTKWKH